MRILKPRLSTAVALVALAIPTAGFAQGDPQPPPDGTWPRKWDLGLFLGFNVVSKKNDLGNAPDAKDVVNSSGLFGLRGLAWVTDNIGAELEFKLVPTEVKRGTGTTASLYGVRGEVLYQFMHEGTVRPYALVGYGQDIFVAKQAAGEREKNGTYIADSDADHAYLAGIGMKWQGLYRIGVRVDLRYVGGEARCNTGTGKNCDRDVLSHNFEGSLGLAYTLGGKPEDTDGDGLLDPWDTCPDQAEDKDNFEDQDGCPDFDNDGDKVPDYPPGPDTDKCPNEPEDLDGFEDYDGCPELDNDKDGVPDDKDKCGTQAEDKDGFQDDDGCPDLDNDGDKIPDVRDKCPNKAEDFDNFQDDDGCPDPDNDGDGIPDVKDKCPNEPETKNGYLDNDGCKDEIPADLAKLTSAPVTGIVFDKKGALDAKKSAAALQSVAGVLAAHESVKVTLRVASVAVDQGMAQARAETIKAFLVTHGVEAERIEAVGESTLAAGAKPPKKAAPDTITVTMK
jgi:outer membrane protein OmpA-like peptidoglycan-associated protein